MKRTSLQLHIAEPCHENWEQMLPQDKGRHCLACQKTVVDFTNLSDKEIIDFFATKASSVCGRFRPEQMHPVVVEATPPVSRWKLFLLALLATVPVKMLFSESAKAQTKTEQLRPEIKMGKVAVVPPFSVSGTVLDAGTKHRLTGVSVQLKGSQRYVTTNQKGVFTMSDLRKGDVLVVHRLGYEPQEVVVQSATTLTIRLDEHKEFLMGAVAPVEESSNH